MISSPPILHASRGIVPNFVSFASLIVGSSGLGF
jgi:hypothetical protein